MNTIRTNLVGLAAASTLMLADSAFAQTGPARYGASITLKQARKATAAGEAEAMKNTWQVVIFIVDIAGYLAALHRLEAQIASVDIATGKALEDGLAAGDADLRILDIRAASAPHRGMPILLDGKNMGGIGSIGGIGGSGVSGVMASQDEIVAMAGAAAVAVAGAGAGAAK